MSSLCARKSIPLLLLLRDLGGVGGEEEKEDGHHGLERTEMSKTVMGLFISSGIMLSCVVRSP